MANEIVGVYGIAGKTIDVMVFAPNSSSQVWSVAGSAFTAYVTANRANYLISASQLGTASQVYVATFPATIPAGKYGIAAFARVVAGTPAESDPPAFAGPFDWSGTAVASLSGVVLAAGSLTTAKFAVGAIDATVLSTSAEQAIAAQVAALAIDGVITWKQITQIIAAALAGKVTGADTANITFRNVSDTVNAIVGVDDANGNRSSATYTFT